MEKHSENLNVAADCIFSPELSFSPSLLPLPFLSFLFRSLSLAFSSFCLPPLSLYFSLPDTRSLSLESQVGNWSLADVMASGPDLRQDLDLALALIAKLRAEKEDGLLRLEQLRHAHLEQQEVSRERPRLRRLCFKTGEKAESFLLRLVPLLADLAACPLH